MIERETEQLQKVRAKMSQIRKQKQSFSEKEKKRKERTHRLVQIGALAEKYLGRKNITPSEFENIAKNLSHQLKKYA